MQFGMRTQSDLHIAKRVAEDMKEEVILLERNIEMKGFEKRATPGTRMLNQVANIMTEIINRLE